MRKVIVTNNKTVETISKTNYKGEIYNVSN